MKNTFGQSISLTLFGESHGAAVGCVIDGITPGLNVDTKYIAERLSKRRPSSAIDTARSEKDEFEIISGVFNGKTTGTPICIVIPNEDKRSRDYEATRSLARPSHADYAAFCKYHGYEDYRGGGHFSGRITAALTAAGGIFLPALEKLGIKIGSHILSCGGVNDRAFENIEDDIAMLQTKAFPLLDGSKEKAMTDRILEAKKELDSVGGVIQTAISGVPAGVGEPWFDSVEGVLSRAMFAIGAVKGIEFGMGFALSGTTASRSNDIFRIKDGKVVTLTNNNGGINGGITNGMPILFNCAIKPTPSIGREQQTVDFNKMENASLTVTGRHDPSIVRRICPVIESVSALVIADMLSQRYGTDVLNGSIKI